MDQSRAALDRFSSAQPQGMPRRFPGVSVADAAYVTGIGIVCLAWLCLFPSTGGVLLIGLLAMACVNYFIGGRDVLYPAFTYSAIWSIAAATYTFCPIEINEIGWKTVAFLLAGAAAFSIGSWLGNRPLFAAYRANQSVRQSIDNPQARNILLCCTIAVTSLLLLIVLRVAGGISGLGPAFLLRLNSPESPLQSAGLVARVIAGSGGLLPVLTLWVLLLEEKRKWKIVLCLVCVCLFPLLVTQRGLIMVAFCGCITILLLRSSDRTLSKRAKPLVTSGLCIVTVMALLSYSKSWVQSPGGFTITQGVWMYIAGPIATFDYAIYHPQTFEGEPAAVFAQVLTPLAKLDLTRYRTLLEVDGQATDRFVFVPFPGNVYTAYKPYYEDFGAIGCLIAFVFFGYLEGCLFYFAARGSIFAVFFFSYLGSALMFSTFDDNYHSFSRHLNILLFIAGYFWLMKRVRVQV